MKTINYIILLCVLSTIVFLSLYGYTPPNSNTLNKETTIYVLPLNGGVSKYEMDSAISYLQSTFPTTTIIMGNNTKLPAYCFNGKRYRADSILNFLNSLDIEADKIIGLTSKDVSIHQSVLQKNNRKVTYPDFGILGLARRPGKVCVISNYRLRNNVNMFAKTVVHEFMHTLGVRHCEHSYCIMQDGKGSGKNMKESNHIHEDCLTQANQEVYY